MDLIASGNVGARDFVTGEVTLNELPQVFEHMKNRNGQLKVAVKP
jgi:threonine dehydrogenase-like Zn-dependent dehydrogenase